MTSLPCCRIWFKAAKNLKTVRLCLVATLLALTWPLACLADTVPADGTAEGAPAAAVAHTAAELKVPARKYVTRTVHIPGGSYASPFVCSQSETEYVLDGDISAAGSAILVRASRVVVNLNGKTVTYNQQTPGEGVYIDQYNLTDIAIINGAIVQGAALSEGDLYGAGNNPIRSKGNERLQVARINARYGGRDVGGIFVSAGNSIFEENLLEDVWTVGTLKNRHQGVSAITTGSGSNIFRNNIIKNCRQRGITTGHNDQVYGNTISINSLATNSYGIMGYKTQHVKVYNNTITGIGEHPIGIGFVSEGTSDIEIYNNRIEVQTTRLGDEYGGSNACFKPATPCGNYAVGFRTTWGGDKISFHDNTIIVRTDARYPGSYSPNGKPIMVDGKGRGLMVAVNGPESARFYNNTITVLDRTGTGKAYGIACTGENFGDLTFEGNTVTSNILNVALGDEYGACGGYPLFIRNIFVKAGNYPVYQTVASEFGGYFEGSGRFVSNRYQGGAAQERINLNPSGKGRQSVYFGREVTVRLESGSIPLGGVSLTLANGGVPFDSTAITAADGSARLIVYDYELHDANSTSSKTLTRLLAPHIVQVVDGAASLATKPEKNGEHAWDDRAGRGTYTPTLYLNGVPDHRKLTLSY